MLTNQSNLLATKYLNLWDQHVETMMMIQFLTYGGFVLKTT